LKLPASFQTVKNSFRSSELWRPQDNELYKEWKDFKESKRIERLGESFWQKLFRTLTGYSLLRSKIDESSNTEEKYWCVGHNMYVLLRVTCSSQNIQYVYKFYGNYFRVLNKLLQVYNELFITDQLCQSFKESAVHTDKYSEIHKIPSQ